jgi:cellulase
MAPLATAALGLLALASTALSHGLVTSYSVDGKAQQAFLLDYYYAVKNGGTMPDIPAWYAENLDIGFVEPNNYGHPDINCHKNAKPGKLYSTVPAGGTVTFDWTPKPWPHPHGPIIEYVAKCNGECTNVDKTSLRWVKIQEKGINYQTQEWASTEFINKGGKWSVTIPRSLAPGNYVLRHEIIALHGASSPNGAQVSQCPIQPSKLPQADMYCRTTPSASTSR